MTRPIGRPVRSHNGFDLFTMLSDDTTDVVLTDKRHATLIAFLQRYWPSLWGLIFRPVQYVFEEGACTGDRSCLCGECTTAEMQDLALAFQRRPADYRTASAILLNLVRLHRRAAGASIGVMIDGQFRPGEHLAEGCPLCQGEIHK